MTRPPGGAANRITLGATASADALIHNALRHEKPGGQVVLQPVRTPTTVSIAVIDTGVGLGPPHRPGELFTRSAHATDTPPEDGIMEFGLALVREIVDHHHGHITVTGAPGRGATFTLIFPATNSVRLGDPQHGCPSASRGHHSATESASQTFKP